MTKTTAKKRSHHKAKPLVANTSASACFSDVRWKSGTAYATFARDGYQVEIEMSRREFKEWADSGSLGGFFNAVLK
jgi:hypothetical protein